MLSNDPDTSPACVETETVPVDRRDVSLASAARPPSAARCFSMTSSAVCANATPAVDEKKLALAFVAKDKDRWLDLAHGLLMANEFAFVD